MEKDCIHCIRFAPGKSPDPKIVGTCELFSGNLTYEQALQGCSSWEKDKEQNEIKISPPDDSALRKINVQVNKIITLKNNTKVLIRTGKEKDRETTWRVLSAQPAVFYRYIHGITRAIVDSWYNTERVDISKNYPIIAFTLNDKGEEEDFIGNSMILFHSPISHQGHVARIELGVIPSFQHFGIGTLILEEAIRVCREIGTIKRIQTTVVCDNIGSVTMFLKSGFKVEAVRAKAWMDGDTIFDTYIMVYFID